MALMRVLLLSLAVISSMSAIGSLTGCASSGNNAAAVQMMDVPVNACGSDGRSNINDCGGGRR